MFQDMIPESIIRYVTYNIPASGETEENAAIMVNNAGVMKQERPVPGGLYDAHMGTTDMAWNCQTCGCTKEHCPGHPGGLYLRYPIKFPLYRNYIMKVLKIVCYECSGLLVRGPPKVAELVKLIKGVSRCPHCSAPRYTITKDKANPIVLYRETKDEKKMTIRVELFNHHIKRVFERITEDTLTHMGIPFESPPKNCIRSVIEVAPNTIRPDIKQTSGNRLSMNDLTILLKTVVDINISLPEQIPPDEQISQIQKERYYALELAYASYIGSGSQMSLSVNSRETKSIIKRLKGKESTARANLLGKRCNNMMRSVITGDPTLRLDEVGIPEEYAVKIGIPETVNERNYEKMLVYFNNGIEKYPGCKHIVKKSTGEKYNRAMLGTYQLQIGDKVYRNLINGDYVLFNRQPSLIYSSVSAMRVKIIDGMTIRINPMDCVAFNADFDGDQANIIIVDCPMAVIECMHSSNIKRWAISLQTRTPTFGLFQDSLTGIFKFTRNGVHFAKWKAMQVMHDVSRNDLNFTKDILSNKEMISMILPKITILGMKPAFYKEAYASFIPYDPEEISVRIVRGVVEQGRFDKGIVGQGQLGSIFQIIANEYGNSAMFDTIYDFGQLAIMLFTYTGFTLGISDMILPEDAKSKIRDVVERMLTEANSVTEKLNAGVLIPPLGVTVKDFYETEQLAKLTTPDDCIYPILAAIKPEDNSLYTLINSGAKGKISNLVSVMAVIGSHTIEGQRFPPQAGFGRSLPYFERFNSSPMANGFNPHSLMNGVDIVSYINSAKEGRHGFINNALSTSVAGYQNRISIKNLETQIANNLRQTAKNFNVLQLLYGYDGCNPAKTEYVKFPTAMLSNVEMETTYHSKAEDFPGADQTYLDSEFQLLLEDRDYYRAGVLALENANPSVYTANAFRYMPVNITRIIDNVVNDYQIIESKLDPVAAIAYVSQLCEELGYVYQNDARRRSGALILEHHRVAVRHMQILIRSYLCTSELSRRGVNDVTLGYICEKIILTYKKALIEPGTSVGLIAAQCVCEQFTQYVLDSKHRTGGQGGSKTNAIIRMQEVLRAAGTSSMKNSHMIIGILPEYEEDKALVQRIANYVEMMTFKQFIKRQTIFYETYGEPTHPDFLHEKSMFTEFAQHHIGITVPKDLAKWCIRIELNIHEMILKSMEMETIVSAISATYPSLFIVYSQENSKVAPVLRIYLRSSQFKSTNDYLNTAVHFIREKIERVVIRGVVGIISTSVQEVSRSYVDENGRLASKRVNMIFTVGTNLAEIIFNPYVDHTRTVSDSIKEMESIYGITTAEGVIVQEMINSLSSLNPSHCSLFSAEMCFNGVVFDVQRNNPRRNEKSNVMLQASFQMVPQVLERAATDAQVNVISGVSAPLMIGTNPMNIGTTYNDIILNEEKIAARVARSINAVDEL